MGFSVVDIQAAILGENDSFIVNDNNSVAFYDQETGQRIFYHSKDLQTTLISSASPMSMKSERSSKLCEHPIEKGSVITDHKVLLPSTFQCEICVPSVLSAKVESEFNAYFLNSKKICIVSRTGVFLDMVLESMPTQMINSRNIARPSYELNFKEVVVVRPQLVNLDINDVVNPEDTDTFETTTNFIQNNAKSEYNQYNIPLNKTPNQNIEMNIDGNNWSILLQTIRESTFATIKKNGVPVCVNTRCVPNISMIPAEQLAGESYNFRWENTPGNEEYPFYENFNSTSFLYYILFNQSGATK